MRSKNVGETIKAIRKNKQMKQTEFSSVKQGTLANIESSKRIPYYTTFESILLDIDMTAYEFNYVQNGFHLSEREQLIQDFIKCKHSLYSNQINTLQNQIEAYLVKNPEDTHIENLLVIMHVYQKINKEQTYNIDSPESKKIWERIDSQEVWYYNDIFTMSRLFYVFPMPLAKRIIKKVLEHYEVYDNYQNITASKIAFLLNSGKFFNFHKLYTEAHPLLQEAKRLAYEEELPMLEFAADYALAVIAHVNGNCELAQNEIDRVCTVLTMINRPLLENDIRRDWNLFLAGHPN
ncbi:helix-turn-helix transcriptional regulator [Listeria booriae]|uniref:helix-turn-helix domain-containing protein n=1 Tax=Listeria booriae TaxID=1552123 RepID=UPI00162651C1|nr:helix-turn-helix transcriptional regulator [Listeria booriae]MBC1914144.1 helix-turn-helix transcriptional regulator [Listeria booriae]